MTKNFIKSVAVGIMGLSLAASCSMLHHKEHHNKCNSNKCNSKKAEKHSSAKKESKKETKKEVK